MESAVRQVLRVEMESEELGFQTAAEDKIGGDSAVLTAMRSAFYSFGAREFGTCGALSRLSRLYKVKLIIRPKHPMQILKNRHSNNIPASDIFAELSCMDFRFGPNFDVCAKLHNILICLGPQQCHLVMNNK